MIDYSEVLADLAERRGKITRQFKAELDSIDAAIVTIERIQREKQASPQQSIPGTEVPRRGDSGLAYQAMTIRAAAEKCLEQEHVFLKTAYLAQHLLAGGVHTDSQNFRASLYSILHRRSEFVNRNASWGLSKWLEDGTCRP